MTNYVNSQSNFRKRNIEGEQSAVVNSRILYEDVVRKNQEIIKQILSKINDLFSKQEDFDCSIRSINEKIARINETAQQLHHQFRANHVELQRKHQGLINDLNGLKGILKIPDLDNHHEEYLQSQFFKQQSAMVSVRSRSRKKIRHKTNFKYPQNTQKFEESQKNENPLHPELNGKLKRFSQIKKIEYTQKQPEDFFQSVNKNQFSNTYAGVQSKIGQSSYNINVLIDEKINQIQQKMQINLSNSKEQMKIKQLQLLQAIKSLENKMEIKLQNISKNLVNQKIHSHIDFQQLHNYLENKYEEKIHEKISKDYFQESLNNLQQSWQKELNQLYAIIDTKIDHQNMQIIDEKIAELRSQLQLSNNLNSIKTNHYSYNSTCKSTPQRQSPTQRSSKENLFSHLCTSGQEESKMLKRNEVLYSNSYSSFSRNKDIKNIVFDQKNCRLKSDDENMVKWKNRVMQTLGLRPKKSRKMKQND